MHDVLHKLYIKDGVIPDTWEAYFIASLHKYSFQDKNKLRFSQNWYREYNFWLDLEANQLDALITVGNKIQDDDALYQWSGFVRYLLNCTTIIKNDEAILEQLIPSLYMGESSALFLLITFVSHIDHALDIYKKKRISEKQIKQNFSVLKSLMNVHYAKLTYYGTPARHYIPKLSWGELFVFNGLGMQCTSKDLPGVVYKNNRSGELVMLADEQKLYDEEGLRIDLNLERQLLEENTKKSLVVDESNLDTHTDQNPAALQTTSLYPDGIWETKYFTTETGGFIGNVFDKNGEARNTVRIFDSGQWKMIVNDESEVIEMFIPDEEHYNFASFKQTVGEALKEFDRKNRHPSVIFLESFLLDPKLKEYLDDNREEDEQFKEFVSRFRLYSISDDKKDVLHHVFPRAFRSSNIKDWPANGRFQSIIKQMALEGKWIRSFGGFILIEDLDLQELDNDKQNK